MGGRVFIGTSGWNYKSWAGGVFYPAELKAPLWLDFYTRHFRSVEVNNTFYRLPERSVFEAWARQVPEDFVFTIKVSRFITHMKKLLEPEQHVAQFLERATGLGRKLDVILFQLPPFWKFNPDRLQQLCEFLGKQRIVPGVRSALEVRNPSWFTKECFEILEEHGVALALTDWPSLKVTGPLTADFVFVRRHGPEGLYSSDYDATLLRRDAEQIRKWRAEDRDVYAYFNNDVHGYAVRNAATLREFVG